MDPEKKYELNKDKIKIMDDDLLSDDSDIIPRNQSWHVIGCISPDPNQYELETVFTFNKFVRVVQAKAKANGQESILEKLLI